MAITKGLDRIKVRKGFLSGERRLSIERARLWTESYKQTDGLSKYLRQAKAFEHTLKNIPITIESGELLVGNSSPVGTVELFPEHQAHFLGEELAKMKQRVFFGETGTGIYSYGYAPEEVKEFEELLDYWMPRCLDTHAKRYLGDFADYYQKMQDRGLRHRSGWQDLGRGGFCPEYEKILEDGLGARIKLAREQLAKCEYKSVRDGDKHDIWEAASISMQAVIDWAHRYAELAEKMAKEETDPQRKAELKQIAEHCRWVPENPPRTFREALQFFWTVYSACYIEHYQYLQPVGRMDQYFYPYYKKDIAEGRLTREAATELMALLFIKISEIRCIYAGAYQLGVAGGGQLFIQNTIGGHTPDGRDATNELTYVELDAMKMAHTQQPSLYLSYHDAMPADLLLSAFELTRMGGGMPAYINSRHKENFLVSLGFPVEQARRFYISGCNHEEIPGQVYKHVFSYPSAGKMVELAMTGGIDILSGERVAPERPDITKWKSIEDGKENFAFYLGHTVDNEVKGTEGYFMAHSHYPNPFKTGLMRPLLEKGVEMVDAMPEDDVISIQMGVIMGPQNAADALAAIKYLVFDTKKVTAEKLLEACKHNFEGDGYGEIHKLCLEAPKYGNDDDYADDMLRWVFDTWRKKLESVNLFFSTTKRGTGHSLATHASTASYFVPLGMLCSALPDGRKAREPLADGCLSPVSGRDKKGITAVLRSAAKMDADNTLDFLFNQRLHPSIVDTEEAVRKLFGLVKGFFDMGGDHIQFNIVSTTLLKDAQKNPDKYRDLVVRVAGYSAYFVELEEIVQNTIIDRTEQTDLVGEVSC